MGCCFRFNWNELSSIDKKEGYKGKWKDNSYERVEITVIKFDGTKIHALTYCANLKGTFTPSQGYMNKLIKGAEECNLPSDYVEELKGIQTKRWIKCLTKRNPVNQT